MLRKKTNQKIIIVYYALALILALIGIYRSDPTFYIAAILVLALALFRKHWLMKRLKE